MRRAVRSRTGRVAAALTAAVAFAVLPAGAGATANEASARNGEIAFIRKSNFYGEGVLHAVDPSTGRVRRLLKSGWVRDARWSPDGKRIAIVDRCAIKVMPASGGRLRTILRPRKWFNSAGGEVSECYTGPDWSPDGRRLVVTRCASPLCDDLSGPALFVVGASGRGLLQLTQRDCVAGRNWACLHIGDGFPDWSPDGERILFQRLDVSLPDSLHGNWANNARLYLVKPDGSDVTRLPPEQARSGRWSPDGTRIAFTRIVWTTLPPGAKAIASFVVMNADGSEERTVVQGEPNTGCSAWAMAWAPDGTKIAYSGPCPRGVYIMDPDGSDGVRITRGNDRVVDWRRLP